MLKSIKTASTLIICACLGAGSTAAIAETSKTITIPAGELNAALENLVQQTGIQLLYDLRQIEGLQTQGVKGAESPQEAVTALLKGTELTTKTDSSGAILISSANIPATISTNYDEGPSIKLAQADTPSPSEGEGQGEDKKQTTDTEYESARRAIPEILVKGSRGGGSLNADIPRSRDDIQPYIVINRERIERSGATNMGDILRKSLPANTSMISPGLTGGPQGDVSNVDLTGLGSSKTLILIDGRRAAPYSLAGSTIQPDLNSIPLSAIERIEILPVSAAGIYGGSAVSGVVNVVLRRDYSGIETTLTYDNTFKASSAKSRAELTGGFAFNGGATSILFAGSYADANPLLTRDRDFYTRGRNTIRSNNPSAFFGATVTPTLGATTNIRSNAPLVGGARPNLTLKGSNVSLGSPYTFIPYGYAGAATDGGAAMIANAGNYNFDLANTAQNTRGGQSYLNTASIVKSLKASLRQEFSKSLSAFIELTGSSNDGTYEVNPTTATFTISRTAQNNPFNQDIMVTTPTFGADQLQRSSLDDLRAIVGLVWLLPWDNWRSSIDYTWERTEVTNITSGSGILAAGTSAITSGAVNVLRDTNAYPVDFGPYIVGGDTIFPIRTVSSIGSVRVGGQAFRLPGGNVDISFQMEYVKDRVGDSLQLVSNQNISVLYPSRERLARSIYTELRLPFVASENAKSWIKMLELQLAGRLDKYRTDTSSSVISINNNNISGAPARATNRFDSTVPNVGLRFAPTSDVMVRASYGKGFSPPDLTQLVPSNDSFFPAGSLAVRDPLRGNAPITTPVTQLNGGNPDLQPEKSTSKSIGIVVTPRITPDLRFSWDWVKIDQRDVIRSLSFSQSALDNELLIPGLVTRAPPQGDGFDVGPVTVINARFLNATRGVLESYNWSVDYSLSTSQLGSFSLEASATQRVHLQTQVVPTAALVESATLSGIPRWLANASLTWKARQMAMSWSTQYLGKYWYQQGHSVDPNFAAAEAPSAIYHDLAATYSFKHGDAHALLANTELLFGVKNVFNTRPRFASTGNLYDVRMDPRLATYYISIRKGF